MRLIRALTQVTVLLVMAACSGGGGDGGAEPDGPSGAISEDDGAGGIPPDPQSPDATYTVLVENFWGPEDFPQGYPDDAHLSLFGGAVHNAAVSFWSFGEPPSAGMIKMAETGHIDILLAEDVYPAIANGTADSSVEVRVFTDPPTPEGPGVLSFDIELKQEYPLVTLVSMLGPSPDWFVGVDGLSLRSGDDAAWLNGLKVDLPLYDGGSRSNKTPVMHGPSIKPPDPIGFVAYDAVNGVYEPASEGQNVARLTFTRIR